MRLIVKSVLRINFRERASKKVNSDIEFSENNQF